MCILRRHIVNNRFGVYLKDKRMANVQSHKNDHTSK